MEQFIGCDAHKKYSVFVAVNERGEASPAIRVGHDREQYRQFLERLPAGSQIALEAGGHYYWMVDEMEAAGHRPRLVHPLEAKKRMGKTGKKTDAEWAKERSSWFRRLRAFRAGGEGRISLLKRRFGLARCRYHGELGMERWVGLGILAHNLCQISHTLIIRRAA